MSDKEENDTQVAEEKEEPTINGKGDAPEATVSTDDKSDDESSQKSKEPQSNGDDAKEKDEEKDDKDEGGSDEDEEEESDEEEAVALLEQPVVVEGKRVRKSVERLTSEILSPEPAEIEMPEGKGDKIGDCKRICYFLDQVKAEELKPLHRFLFGRQGKLHMIKKDIKTFNGFGFEKDSPEYKKKYEFLDRFFTAALKFLCETFDLEKKGTKEDLKNRFWEFIINPKDSGKPLPGSKKSESSKSSSKSKKKSKPKRPTSKKSTPKRKEKPKPKDSDEDDSLSDLSDDDLPAKKKKASLPKVKAVTPKKKATPKKATPKAAAKKSSPKKASPKKTPVKKAAAKRKADDDDEDDEVPLAKKANAPPTNKDIKTLVKKLLDGADLSTVTMKNIIQKVYDKYPSHDLSARREFIRNSVKEIIS